MNIWSIRTMTALLAVLGLSLVGPGSAVAQEGSEEAAPVDLLTAARGAVLVEASHKPRDAYSLIDGDPASTWSIATKRNPAPYVFTFELMAPANLSAVGVSGAGERPGGVVGGSAKTIVIEGAAEPRGGAFRPLASLEAGSEGVSLAEVSDPEPVQALRFTVQGAQSPEAAFLYLAEVVAQGEMPLLEEADRFTGQFLTGRSTHIELKQDGLNLTGCYSENSGRSFGTIEGSVVDGVALVNWQSDQGITGTALLTIDSTGALSGVRYRHRSRSTWGGPPSEETASLPCSAEQPPANPILAGLQKDGEVKIYGILFNHDSDVPRSISLPALTQLQEALEAEPGMVVLIEGHTDADGSDSYNQDLSSRRAASVVAWLTERGIAAERLGSEGRGEKEPVASNKTADGKALNRRVEVSVVK